MVIRRHKMGMGGNRHILPHAVQEHRFHKPRHTCQVRNLIIRNTRIAAVIRAYPFVLRFTSIRTRMRKAEDQNQLLLRPRIRQHHMRSIQRLRIHTGNRLPQAT
jgi:hypothetical protein